LIVNGDFELNLVPDGSFASQIPYGWQSTTTTTTDIVVVSSVSPSWAGTGNSAPSGKYYLGVRSGSGNAYLQQKVVVPASLVGSRLALQFHLSKRSDGSGASSSVAVSINNIVLQTITLANSFTRYSISVSVTNSTMIVKFNDVSQTTGDRSFLMDNVSLSFTGTY
jgi:hypothetical protein